MTTIIMHAVTCPYCGQPSEMIRSSVSLYGGLDCGPVWICFKCHAWTGCRADGTPRGRIADKTLRRSRNAAYTAFDKLWKSRALRDQCSKRSARDAAYRWVADQMSMSRGGISLGQLDASECQRVAALCNTARRSIEGKGDK